MSRPRFTRKVRRGLRYIALHVPDCAWCEAETPPSARDDVRRAVDWCRRIVAHYGEDTDKAKQEKPDA